MHNYKYNVHKLRYTRMYEYVILTLLSTCYVQMMWYPMAHRGTADWPQFTPDGQILGMWNKKFNF